jgi:pyridoxal 5'-phosphate synthase pdxT subunit
MTVQPLTIGVLALQGAFIEHIQLLHRAAEDLQRTSPPSLPSNPGAVSNASLSHAGLESSSTSPDFTFIEVRTPAELARCSALVIPGGESTSISLIAERTGLLEPLRQFVKVARRPVWGTCAGLILLAESANRSKSTGQELIGGLDVRVHRNYFGRQVESFEADLDLAFLGEGEARFHSVFIRAPVVEKILPPSTAVDPAEDSASTVTAPPRKATTAEVEILGRLPGRAKALSDSTTTAAELGEDGDIIAVKQGNVFATAFHPELTGDGRIHSWWLKQVVAAAADSV